MSGAMHLSFIQLAQNTTAYRHAYDRVLYALVYITAHFFFFFCSHAGLRFLVKYENRRVTHVYTGCCRGNATHTISPYYSHAGSKRRAPELCIPDP